MQHVLLIFGRYRQINVEIQNKHFFLYEFRVKDIFNEVSIQTLYSFSSYFWRLNFLKKFTAFSRHNFKTQNIGNVQEPKFRNIKHAICDPLGGLLNFVLAYRRVAVLIKMVWLTKCRRIEVINYIHFCDTIDKNYYWHFIKYIVYISDMDDEPKKLTYETYLGVSNSVEFWIFWIHLSIKFFVIIVYNNGVVIVDIISLVG